MHEPVSIVVIVNNPQWHCNQEEQVSYCQVQHEYLDFVEFLGVINTSENPEHVAVGDKTQNENDAVENSEEVIAKRRVYWGCTIFSTTFTLSRHCAAEWTRLMQNFLLYLFFLPKNIKHKMT